MGYPGLFNSSYHPSPLEAFYISTPADQLGPVETGQVLVAVLQGMLLVQYYEYVRDFWNEKRWSRWLVHLAFALSLAKFAYVWYFAWDRFIPHYGDWAYMAVFSPIAVPVGISTTIPSAVCQIFYIHRCWALSRNWIFLIVAISALVLTVGSGITLTYGGARAAGGDVKVTNLILVSINLSLASALVCDIFITTFTCFYLIREKTGFKETDGLVSRLVKCSIESAAGPTIVALINLILSNKATDNQWFLLPNLTLSHVYACSLLYSVNARKVVGMRTPLSTANSAKHVGTSSSRSTGHTRTNPPIPKNDFPLRDRTLSPKASVFVNVQTSVHEEYDMHGPQISTESGGKRRSQGDDSYDLPRGKERFFV